MTIAYRCEPGARLVVEVFHGDVSFADFREHAERQAGDPAWLATTKALSDLSTARIPHITDRAYDEIAELLGQRPDRASGRTIAIVGGSEWETATDAERAAAAKISANAIVFNNPETACKWLGVDPDMVQATIADLRSQLRAEG